MECENIEMNVGNLRFSSFYSRLKPNISQLSAIEHFTTRDDCEERNQQLFWMLVEIAKAQRERIYTEWIAKWELC